MTRALVQFTDEQIQEATESHDDAEAQVMAYLAREHVERGR